jgi:hypothetical protein
MDVKPLLFSFFGRKTNLLFLCWLWENVLVFLTLWEKKGKEKGDGIGASISSFPITKMEPLLLFLIFP